LASIGVPVTRLPAPDINEDPRPGELPDQYVQRLAREKAYAGWRHLSRTGDAAVLGADTTVVLAQRILGKPRDRAEACDMLAALAGREHQVLSAVTVLTDEGEYSALSVSRVRFVPLTRAEIEA